MKNKLAYLKNHQEGLASIVIVFVIIIVLSLLSLGFARLMDRATRQATANNLGAAADFAALAGINQTAAYIRGEIQANRTVTADNCDDLTKTGAPLAGLTDLSGNSNVQYTCVLVNPTTDDLLYKNMPAYRSQVLFLKSITKGSIKKLMFSWQSNDPKVDSFPTTNNLLSESAWSQSKFHPMLRLTLYPVVDGNNGYVTSNTKTFFLYPRDISNGNVTTFSYGNEADGKTENVDCTGVTTIPSSTFTGSPDFKCNVVITGMGNAPSPDYFYARFTPLYGSADIKIQANDGNGNALKFAGEQYLVDVTAKANNAVKRLQARVDGGDILNNIGPFDNGFSEYGLRTANAACKRLVVNGTSVVVDDSGNTTARCHLGFSPEVVLNVSATNNNGSAVGAVKDSTGTFSCGTKTQSGSPWSDTNCSAQIPVGTSVSMNVSTTNSTTFSQWTAGPCSGTATKPCVFSMPANNLQVTASFTHS